MAKGEHLVQVHATNNAAGGVDFLPQSDLIEDDRFVFDKKKEGMSKDQDHKITFKLIDNTGLGLRFPKEKKDAMWVIRDNLDDHQCPDHNSVSDYSVLGPHKRISDTELEAYNKNKHPGEFWSFSLNFVRDGKTDKDKSAYVRWDPITENRNRGRSPIMPDSTRNAIIGVAAVAIVVVAVLSFTSWGR